MVVIRGQNCTYKRYIVNIADDLRSLLRFNLTVARRRKPCTTLVEINVTVSIKLYWQYKTRMILYIFPG